MRPLNFLLITLCCLTVPSQIFAAISFDVGGKWSTTFDCNDWVHPNSGSCDGLTLTGGGDAGVIVNKTQITSSANNSSGAGGKGIRYWVAAGDKNLSAPIYINLPDPKTELWIRYYTRWEEGVKWLDGLPAFEKSWYIRTWPSGDPSAIPGLVGSVYRISNQGGYTTSTAPGGGWTAEQLHPIGHADSGWTKFYPTGTSTGGWQCVDLYLKMQSGTATFDGVGRVWVNGDLVAEATTADWVGANTDALQGWIQLMFRSNQSNLDIDREMYVDYDDIVVYNTTPPNTDSAGNPFIGPIGWGGGNPPTLQNKPARIRTANQPATISTTKQPVRVR